MKDQCRLDIRKYLFSQRTTNILNKLSINCVNISSMNEFDIFFTNISGGQVTHI